LLFKILNRYYIICFVVENEIKFIPNLPYPLQDKINKVNKVNKVNKINKVNKVNKVNKINNLHVVPGKGLIL